MNQFSHPFKNGIKETPEGKQAELAEIRDWLTTQPHLPTISDEYIYLFLHSNFYDIIATKNTIECYFTLKTATPYLFGGRDLDLPRIKTVQEITHLVALPNKTVEGYNILIYSLADSDYTKLNSADVMKYFCMFFDMRLSEDCLSEGYIVIFDMGATSLGHLTRISIPAMRAFMVYIQDAHPARIKKICVVHTTSIINQIMYLVKPFIKSSLMDIIYLTKNGPETFIEAELLPKDYGGPLPLLENLSKVERIFMEENYKEWLKDSDLFKVEEKKRIKKPSRGLFASLIGSNRALDID